MLEDLLLNGPVVAGTVGTLGAATLGMVGRLAWSTSHEDAAAIEAALTGMPVEGDDLEPAS